VIRGILLSVNFFISAAMLDTSRNLLRMDILCCYTKIEKSMPVISVDEPTLPLQNTLYNYQ